jgi:hypothetical protein
VGAGGSDGAGVTKGAESCVCGDPDDSGAGGISFGLTCTLEITITTNTDAMVAHTNTARPGRVCCG